MYSLRIIASALLALTFVSNIEGQDNLAPFGVAMQSSDWGVGQFPASFANDGNLGNFTATGTATPNAIWEVDLGVDVAIDSIVVHNRDNCCQSRLRDIIVSVHDISFVEDVLVDELLLDLPVEEVEDIWESALFETSVLNLENELGGGGTGGPEFLTIDLNELVGKPVTGRFVRIVRVADPDLSGTGGVGNEDEANLLSIGEVEVFGVADVDCPDEGDTHCEEILVTEPAEGGPGIYDVSVFADDDSGDDVRYTIVAENEIGTRMTVGPTLENLASFNLGIGTWTITATVDDDPLCEDAAPDAECSTVVEIENTTGNLALEGIATQSSDFNPNLGAALANDANLLNFTATASADVHPIWEIDLRSVVQIGSIIVHNRGDGCCQSRLRDIIVSIHDVPFTKDVAVEDIVGEVVEEPVWESALFESEMLNVENELGGGGPTGPAMLVVDLEALAGKPIRGRYVRVLRISDPDLSGTGGLGNADEANVLSLGEVEIFAESLCEGPGDTHCEELVIDGPAEGGEGDYSVTVFADDDSGDAISYTIVASESGGEELVFGPSEFNSTTFALSEGEWTIRSTVDDGDGCPAADDASCEVGLRIGGDSPVLFVRGDVDSSGAINLSDGISLLLFQFQGGQPPACGDAADTDNSGAYNLTDAIIVFQWLFLGGNPPVNPEPSGAGYVAADCGEDDGDDAFDCVVISPICQ